MAEIMEMLIMFIKLMFCGVGAIVAFMVFLAVVYLALIVIKSFLQTAFQDVKTWVKLKQEKKWNSLKKNVGKNREGKTA